jgi:hypothetical protein
MDFISRRTMKLCVAYVLLCVVLLPGELPMELIKMIIFCMNTLFKSQGLLQHCIDKGMTIIYQPPVNFENGIIHQEKKVFCKLMLELNMLLPIIKKVVDQSRREIDVNSHSSACYYHADNRVESDDVYKLNEDVENKANEEQTDLLIHDGLKENDASTTIEQQLQVEAALDSVEVNKADKANNTDGHASTDSDDRINVENKTNDEQADLIIHDGFETNDVSMTTEQELQVEAALDSVEVNKADNADRINVENMANDERTN